MTNIEQQQQLFQQNKLRIMEMLRWTELDYHNFQFESAYEYFQFEQIDPYWSEAMVRTTGFWKFWINQWNLRNEHQFLAKLHTFRNRKLAEVYKIIHSHNAIIGHPNRKVFEDAYAVMIGSSFFEIQNPTQLCTK